MRPEYRVAYEYAEDGFFIIDVGCYDAEHLSIIKEHTNQHGKNIYAVGIDEDASGLDKTFETKIDKFLHKPFEDVDVDDNLFGKADLVICIGVGNGLGTGEKQRRELHMQLAKFLKPDGVIMIEFMTDQDGYVLQEYKFVNFMTRKELIEHSGLCVKDHWFNEKPCRHGILISQIPLRCYGC